MSEDTGRDAIADESERLRRLKERPSRARYDQAHASLQKKWRRRELRADRMMREVVDVLWDHFAGSPYSWCGFYLPAPSGEELVLGPHRDKPACSPLAMHGVCGQVFRSGQAMVVADVRALGDKHIVCDPKNLSEIALPVLNFKGQIIAVFDVDSEAAGAFDDMDQRWLERILKYFQDVDKPE